MIPGLKIKAFDLDEQAEEENWLASSLTLRRATTEVVHENPGAECTLALLSALWPFGTPWAACCTSFSGKKGFFAAPLAARP